MVTLLVLGLATTFTLNFLVGASLFLFSVALVSFLTWGLVSGWGSELVILQLRFGPNSPSSSRKVFIFLTMVWVRAESGAPQGTFDQLGCSIPSECMGSLHQGDIYFYIYCFDQ